MLKTPKLYNHVPRVACDLYIQNYWRKIDPLNYQTKSPIDQYRYIYMYIEIQHKTIDLSTRLWGINTEFVGFIPHSLMPIVLS